MNKYQEAYYWIEKCYYGSNQGYFNEEQLLLIRELVDRETPMKPIIESGMFEVCKNCGEQGHRCINFINEHNYCSNCGQRIDWGDEK